MKHFYDHYFKPQDVTPMNLVFTKEHLVLSGLVITIILMVLYSQRKKGDVRYSQKVLRVLGALMFSLELFRIAWRVFYYGLNTTIIRFDWCNQVCMVLPFIAMFRTEKLYPFIDVQALIGGMGVLIYPLWVFYDYAGIHTLAVQSMISHGLMVLISLTLPMASETYVRNTKNYPKSIFGLLIILSIAFIASHLTGQNYLIMLSADGIPVLQNMAYPSYWLIAFPLMLIVCYAALFGLSIVDHFNLKRFHRRVLKYAKRKCQSHA